MDIQKDITSELGAKKAYLQGTDKQGRAVSIIVGSKHSKTKRDLEETKRLICYSLDAAIDRCDLSKNPSGKVVAVFDLRGERLSSCLLTWLLYFHVCHGWESLSW